MAKPGPAPKRSVEPYWYVELWPDGRLRAFKSCAEDVAFLNRELHPRAGGGMARGLPNPYKTSDSYRWWGKARDKNEAVDKAYRDMDAGIGVGVK